MALGNAFTITCLTNESVQPPDDILYCTNRIPGPARVGLNEFPTTPCPLKVPPLTIGDIKETGAFTHTIVSGPVKNGFGVGSIVIVRVVESGHPPTESTYFIVTRPVTAAFAGLKTLPLTPGPLNTPPVTVGTKTIGGAFLQMVAGNGAKVATGSGLTSTVLRVVSPQPRAATVYCMVWKPKPAVAGLKTPPEVVPGPENTPPGVAGVKFTEGAFTQYAVSSPLKFALVQAGDFLEGVLSVSQTSILLGAESLVDAIDELLRVADWELFLTMLPRLRAAFERLHARHVDSLADVVARKYGLIEDARERLTELNTSLGAAAMIADVDRRVAELMLKWRF